MLDPTLTLFKSSSKDQADDYSNKNCVVVVDTEKCFTHANYQSNEFLEQFSIQHCKISVNGFSSMWK